MNYKLNDCRRVYEQIKIFTIYHLRVGMRKPYALYPYNSLIRKLTHSNPGGEVKRMRELCVLETKIMWTFELGV